MEKKKTTKKVDKKEPKEVKEITKFTITLTAERCFAKDEGEARVVYDESRFGELKSGKIVYACVEALFLLEKGRIDLKEDGKKALTFDQAIQKVKKFEPNVLIRYVVYKDMRNRGYIVKTALKFGADFRVYDRGVKPGEDHAKWVLFPVHEGSVLTWHEFSAKNRVAHSTRKRLLLGIVDEEHDVTYYSVAWTRP